MAAASAGGKKPQELLYDAIRSKDQKRVAELLKNKAVSTDPRGAFSPLLECLDHYDETILRMLLKKGANPNFDWPGQFPLPLVKAVETSNKEAVSILLEHGALMNNVYQRTTTLTRLKSDSPLTQAIRMKDLDMIKFLVENGADINFDGNVYENGDAGKVTKHRPVPGFTPALLLAIKMAQPEIVEFLLSMGAAYKEPEEYGINKSYAPNIPVINALRMRSRWNRLKHAVAGWNKGAAPTRRSKKGRRNVTRKH